MNYAVASAHYTPCNRPDRIINWPKYNTDLKRRGSIELWVDKEAFVAPQAEGGRGRPFLYGIALIEMLLLLKLKYRLPYRALEGFAEDLFKLLFPLEERKAVPSFGTIAERVRRMGKTGAVKRLTAISLSPLGVLVDSTGLSIRGAGSWRVSRPYGGDDKKRRTFLKLHIAVNPLTGQIEAAAVTDQGISDASMVKPLLEQIGPSRVVSLAADGAYDRVAIYKYCVKHGIRDIKIPPRKDANLWLEGTVGHELRNKAVTQIEMDGSKAPWKRDIGYHVRSLVETAMSRIQKASSSRLFSSSSDGRLAEVFAICQLLNREARVGLPIRNKRWWTDQWPVSA